MTTSVRLNSELNSKLNMLVFVTKRSKSSFITQALEMYLDEIEDLSIATQRITSSKRNYMSSSDLKKRLGLDE